MAEMIRGGDVGKGSASVKVVHVREGGERAVSPPSETPITELVGQFWREVLDAQRSKRAETKSLPAGGNAWPVLSEGLGVHPEQIEETKAHMKAHGVPTEFTKDGRAVFTSEGHKRRACKLFGVRDRAGYVG